METAKKGETLVFCFPVGSVGTDLAPGGGRRRGVVGPGLRGQILPVPLLVCASASLEGSWGEAGGGTGSVLSLSGPGSRADAGDVWAATRACACAARQEPAGGDGEGAAPGAFCSFWCL